MQTDQITLFFISRATFGDLSFRKLWWTFKHEKTILFLISLYIFKLLLTDRTLSILMLESNLFCSNNFGCLLAYIHNNLKLLLFFCQLLLLIMIWLFSAVVFVLLISYLQFWLLNGLLRIRNFVCLWQTKTFYFLL